MPAMVQSQINVLIKESKVDYDLNGAPSTSKGVTIRHINKHNKYKYLLTILEI